MSDHDGNGARRAAAAESFEQVYPSTQWEWRRAKIKRPPQGQRVSAPKGRRWYSLPRWDRRRALTIKVVLRGGSECYVDVHARGSRGLFHGATAIYDVVREVMALDQGTPEGRS